MSDFIREVVVQKEVEVPRYVDSFATQNARAILTVQNIIYFLFGILDAFLVFRFLLKVLGANVTSPFVAGIYSFTSIFVAPFEGIFRSLFGTGAETTSVFEPATLIAILFYAFLAWGIVKFVQVLSGRKEEALS
jgi:uncharacterized membrane protein